MIEKIKWVSSLEKVFPDREPKGAEWEKAPSFLAGEVYSLQCAFWAPEDMAGTARVELSGPFAEYVKVREVCPVPSRKSIGGGKDIFVCAGPVSGSSEGTAGKPCEDLSRPVACAVAHSGMRRREYGRGCLHRFG